MLYQWLDQSRKSWLTKYILPRLFGSFKVEELVQLPACIRPIVCISFILYLDMPVANIFDCSTIALRNPPALRSHLDPIHSISIGTHVFSQVQKIYGCNDE